MQFQVRSVGQSDVGRRRDHNEDSFLCDDAHCIYIVADGMGGHAAGEVASAEAVDQVYGMLKGRFHLVEELKNDLTNPDALAKVHRLFESAVQSATYMIHGMAEVSPDQHGMGTTLSSLMVVGPIAIVAQVGDSRVYRMRQGKAQQVTEDHTLINHQLKTGQLTPEQAKVATHGNLITRAVGIRDYVEVDIFDVAIAPGDRFLLCSDGLSDYLTELDEVAAVACRAPLEPTAQGLINLANQRGGKDNITAVLVEIGAPQNPSG